MPRRRPPDTAPRRRPIQARSTALVDAILRAAIRVLEREGAPGFTTIRVAEVAGVSVGSLYQYFPNKHAILFRLQSDEWEATGAMLGAILGDRTRPVAARLRAAMRAFFRSECEEAPLRRALADAAPSYRDSPAARAQHRRGEQMIAAFVDEAAPGADARARRRASELVGAVTGALGKDVSERGLAPAAVDDWADAVADMLLGHLTRIDTPRAARPARRSR